MPTFQVAEEIVYRQTIDEFGRVNVQRVTRLIGPDGAQIGSEQYHRHVITPDDDDAAEPAEVKAVVALARSTERLALYQVQRDAATERAADVQRTPVMATAKPTT